MICKDILLIIYMMKLVFLLLGLFILFLIYFILFNKNNLFSNFLNNLKTQNIKKNKELTDTDILIKNLYDVKSDINITNNGSYKVWRHYPIFKLGSYAQITNNLRYYDNPDIGNCSPTEFCGSIYENKMSKSNYIQPLPPIESTIGTRIGYFITDNNFLPFRNNSTNILY